MENWQLTPAQNIGLPMHQQLKSARREGGLVNFITHLLWYCSIKMYLKIYHRLSVTGRNHLPAQGPYVLVSNHASHLDTLVLASVVGWRRQGRVYPVAAGDTFFSTCIAGTLSAMMLNALPMWRHRACAHGLTDLRDRLTHEQCIYIIFPEGTRSRTGEMSRFHAGVGMLVAGTPVPVVPCFVSGTFRALPVHRQLPKPVKLTVTIGNPMCFDQAANDRGGWESIAKTTCTAANELREVTS